MKMYSFALLGFGNVGQALARLLLRKRQILNEQYGYSSLRLKRR